MFDHKKVFLSYTASNEQPALENTYFFFFYSDIFRSLSDMDCVKHTTKVLNKSSLTLAEFK